MRHRKKRHSKPLTRCGGTGLVIHSTELEAKMVLAERQHKDRGEKRAFKCPFHNHWHLTEQAEKPRVELTLSH